MGMMGSIVPMGHVRPISKATTPLDPAPRAVPHLHAKRTSAVIVP